MQHQVLERGTQAAEVDAVVAVETLVLGVDEHREELRVDGVIGNRGAVLVVVLADGLAVGAVQVTGFGIAGVHDAVGARRLAEEPQEVDVHSDEIEQEQDDERPQCCQCLDPPGAATVQSLVPLLEAAPVAGDDITGRLFIHARCVLGYLNGDGRHCCRRATACWRCGPGAVSGNAG